MKCTMIAMTLVLLGSFAFANEEEHLPKSKPVELQPAERYSGSTPVDITNGLSFNNGTYGKRNAEYEAWGNSPTVVPGLSEKIYPYSMKKNFVSGLQERITFFEHALYNWEQTTPNTKPEAVEYGKNAINQIRPFLDKLRDTTKTAGSASEGKWEGAQADARKALIDVYGLYTRLHHNVPR